MRAAGNVRGRALRQIGRLCGLCALKPDRAIYLVNDEAKTYQYLRCNSQWERLPPEEHEANKRAIDGYRRIFRAG